MEMTTYCVYYEMYSGSVTKFYYDIAEYDTVTVDEIARDYADSVNAVILSITEIDFKVI